MHIFSENSCKKEHSSIFNHNSSKDYWVKQKDDMSAEFIFSVWLKSFILEFFNGSTWKIKTMDMTTNDTFPKWSTSSQLLSTGRIPLISFAQATPNTSIMKTTVRIYHTPMTPRPAVEVQFPTDHTVFSPLNLSSEGSHKSTF